MGRLDKVMSRVSLDTEESTTETVATPELTHDALGVFKNELTGEWTVAMLKFNPTTKQASVVDTLVAGDKELVTERFKILAVEKNLV